MQLYFAYKDVRETANWDGGGSKNNNYVFPPS